MPEANRYLFHPLERRGLLLGLDAGQLLTFGGGAVLALLTHAALGGTGGVLGGLCVGMMTAVAALWPVHGRPLGSQAIVAGGWLLRRSSGPVIDDSPRLGRPGSKRSLDRPSRPAAWPRGALRGIEVVEDTGFPGDTPIGVVKDRRSATLAAVVQVRGASFSLLDPAEQAEKLEGWRRVLGTAARPGAPVTRIQWLYRSTTRRSITPDTAVPAGSPTFACHDAWLVLVVAGGSRGSTRTSDLRRELRLLEGQLAAAALEAEPPLDPEGLSRLIAGPWCSNTSNRNMSSPATGWPLAADDGWSSYRTDGVWHATYWISEWPRVEVGPDFLAPLLVGPSGIAVSVVMAPVSPERALREVRSARTADLADAELRSRAGFLPSTRRDREAEGVTRRESELTDGHHEFRFSGYLTVSAESTEQLVTACAETEHAAQSAQLEIRRLFGRQAEAFTWTLPLGRGLR